MHGKLITNEIVNLSNATNSLAVIFKETAGVSGLE